MNPSPFLLALKNKFTPQIWPRVFVALRQDRLIWSALESTDLGKRALETLPAQPDKWSPGALSLLASESALQLDVLVAGSPASLDSSIMQRANQAYDDWLEGRDLSKDLATTGLLAVAMLERIRAGSSMAATLAEANLQHDLAKTVLACLYGMLLDPSELIRALVTSDECGFHPHLAVHVFLANPLPAENQSEILHGLLTGLTLERGLALLQVLAEQRPWLMAKLASEFLGSLSQSATPWVIQEDSGETPASQFDGLSTAWRMAQIYQLASQPERAVTLLAEGLRVIRRLRGHMSAQLAQSAAQANKSSSEAGEAPAQETGLEAWKQAAQLVPDAPLYSAGLAESLMEAGRAGDAYTYLKTKELEGQHFPHPSLALACARTAAQLGRVEESCQLACQGLELAEAGQELSQAEFVSLARLFVERGLFQEVQRAAQLGLERFPFNRDMLSLLAQAQSTLGQPVQAFSNAYAALAVGQAFAGVTTDSSFCLDGRPEEAGVVVQDEALQRLVVENLEAAGEWQAALGERAALVEKLESPGVPDLLALARCALRAGKPDQAVKSCQKALAFSPDDIAVHQLLAEAAQAMGDYAAAVEHYSQITRIAPQQAEIWLALAQVHKLAGQDAQALNVLRAASQAEPNEPTIHLALGETYIQQGAFTQALSSLRRAASLSSSDRIALRLGQSLLHLGHIDEAHQVLQQAYDSVKTNIQATETGEGSSEQSLAPNPELAYAYAQALLGTGDVPKAISLLKDVIRIYPDDPGPSVDMARALLQHGDQPAAARRAIPFLLRVLSISPERVDIVGLGQMKSLSRLQADGQALLAEAYAKVGDLEESMQAYRKALESPLNREPGKRLSFGLGLVALKLDQPETAVAALQDAAQAEPLSPSIQRALSEAYLTNGLAEEAFQTAKAARDLNPSDPEMLTWFAEQGMRLIDQPGAGQLPVRGEVIQALQEVAELAPSRGDLLVRLGKLQIESGDRQSALDTFHRLAAGGEVQGTTVRDLYEVSTILRQMEEPQLALELLQQAIDESAVLTLHDESMGELESADLYKELAAVYWQIGDLRAALGAVSRGLMLNPERKDLHLQKSDLLVTNDNFTEALDCLTDALSLEPNAADVHYALAEVLQVMGNLSDALDHAKRSMLAADKSNDEAASMPAILLAADLAYSMLRPQEARSFLGETLPQMGSLEDQVEYACLVAELALDEKDAFSAAKAVAVVRRLAPDDLHSLLVEARLANLQGDRDAGSQLLKEALQKLDAEELSAQSQPLRFRRRWNDCERGGCRAGQEFSLWEEAWRRACKRAGRFPVEPLAQFQKAQLLVERAENQNLCRALEVVQHAPIGESLPEDPQASFLEAIQESERQLTALGVLETKEDVDLWGDEAWRAFYLWRARGMVAFQPDAQTIQDLQDVLAKVKCSPEDIGALLMAWIQVGEGKRAVQALQKEWIIHTKYPLVMTLQALALATEDPQRGLEVAEIALSQAARGGCIQCPETPKLHYLVAWLAFLAGDLDKARRSIQEALAAWPEEPRWHALAAKIYQAKDEADGKAISTQSLASLEQAVRLEPNHAPHRLALGKAFQKSGDFRRAAQELEQASQLDPRHAEIWFSLAQAQQATGDLEGAAASAERAIELSPDPMLPLQLRAEIALQTNNPRGALSRAQAALRLQPDNARALYLLAHSLEALNRPDEALTALERAMTSFENPMPMLLERAQLLRRTQGLDVGMKALQELVARDVHNPELLALLTEWLHEAGKDEIAVQAARSALQEGQEQLPAERCAGLHYLIGENMRRDGQLDQAIYHLNEAVSLSPSHLEAYLELGRAYQERREYKQALKVFQKAINTAGGDYRPYYQAGVVLKDSKDYLAAEAMLRKAAQLAPNEVSIHRLLGAVVALNLVHNRRLAPMDSEAA